MARAHMDSRCTSRLGHDLQDESAAWKIRACFRMQRPKLFAHPSERWRFAPTDDETAEPGSPTSPHSRYDPENRTTVATNTALITGATPSLHRITALIMDFEIARRSDELPAIRAF